MAAAGALLDVPLGHKGESFPHFDTITVPVADAPRPDEILAVMAIDGVGCEIGAVLNQRTETDKTREGIRSRGPVYRYGNPPGQKRIILMATSTCTLGKCSLYFIENEGRKEY